MALTKATNRMTTGAQINIKDFESLKVGIDWQPAIQAAIDSLDTGSDYITGGVIYFPVGRYYIKSPIVVRTTGEGTEKLASITLQGEGIHNTIIDCAAGFVGNGDSSQWQAIQALDPTYCAFKDFQILGNNRVAVGLELEGGAPLVAGSEILVERVFSQNFTASCFLVHRCFMVTMTQCRSKGGVTGFDFSGDYNTSLNISNCYALNTNAAGQGFLISDVSYSNFTACGADATGRYGYRVRNTAGVSFDSCGAEDAKRSGFLFEANTTFDDGSLINGTRCTLNSCFTSNCDLDNTGYGSVRSELENQNKFSFTFASGTPIVGNNYTVNGSTYNVYYLKVNGDGSSDIKTTRTAGSTTPPATGTLSGTPNLTFSASADLLSSIDVEINRYVENNVKGSVSVTNGGVDKNQKLSLNSCKLTGALASTVAVIDPIDVTRVNNLAVTGANTPVVDLANVFGSSNNYSGILNILATHGIPTSGSQYNSAAYVLLVTKSAGSATIVEIAKNGLTTGGNANHPSFTWTLDSTNNELEASPVGSTSGNFYFYIGQIGSLSPS